MDTLELRNIVMAQIAQIEDNSFLAALKTIIETKVEPKIFLNSAQRKELEESALEAKKGLLNRIAFLTKK